MTDENKFFRFLWRFNAIFLAGLGIVLAVMALFNALNRWEPRPPAPVGNFAPVPRNAESQFTYRLQSYGEHRLVGREELIALDRWKGAPETYGLMHMEIRSSDTYISTRSVNLLAIDESSAESHWVFRGYNRAITGNDPIYASIPVNLIQPQSPVIALVMTLADLDTDKDGELTEKDRQSLYVYRPDSAGAVRLLTADVIVARHQTASDRYLVIYENGRSGVAATFSVPDFKLISEKSLPKVPNG